MKKKWTGIMWAVGFGGGEDDVLSPGRRAERMYYFKRNATAYRPASNFSVKKVKVTVESADGLRAQPGQLQGPFTV